MGGANKNPLGRSFNLVGAVQQSLHELQDYDSVAPGMGMGTEVWFGYGKVWVWYGVESN